MRLADYLDESYRGRKTPEQRLHLVQLGHLLEFQAQWSPEGMWFNMDSWGHTRLAPLGQNDGDGRLRWWTMRDAVSWLLGKRADGKPVGRKEREEYRHACGSSGCALGWGTFVWPEEIRMVGGVPRSLDGARENSASIQFRTSLGGWSSHRSGGVQRWFGMNEAEQAQTFNNGFLNREQVIERLFRLANFDIDHIDHLRLFLERMHHGGDYATDW